MLARLGEAADGGDDLYVSGRVLRVVARNVEKLERLLILAHPTEENQKRGTLGGTPLDDFLVFLEREVNELTEDAPHRELY